MSVAATQPILPIDALRGELSQLIEERSVVITAPTGTGKSTQVPRWLFQADKKVLVIQPRRVAARAVAARIAELEERALGKEVGYRVRDDDASSGQTRLLVVTPGIVLSRPGLLDDFDTVIIDELHERRLDTDLILALLQKKKARYIAMSATLDGEKVAAVMSAAHLFVEARTFPVEISYLDAGGDLPDARDLDRKVLRALSRLQTQEGDVLVFLPGRGEIERVAGALSSTEFEVVPLHGSLSLKEQSRALQSTKRRRVIVSTNVAETSLTIPSVRVVLDSGLVRRTTYHHGRSYLALTPVALDSADQRAGRAGRVAAGECVRLWGNQARLQKETPPEVYRESLVPLVMTCASLKEEVSRLPFLSAPKDYALSDARERLAELGAIRCENGIDVLTPTGEALHGLPLDPWLSRILVEAKKNDCLDEAIDLVAALEQPFASKLASLADDEDLELPHCDLEALVWAIRNGRATGPTARSLSEARRTVTRLREAFVLGRHPERDVDRRKLLKTLLQADPVCAHVSRQRKRRVVFSNGGTEIDLGRESRVNRLLATDDPRAPKTDAIVVLETRGISQGEDKKLLITLATPVPLKWLAECELGVLNAKEPQMLKKGPNKGAIVATAERVYAGRVVEAREIEPTGEFFRKALVDLFVRGTINSKLLQEAKKRTAMRSLAASLGTNPEYAFFAGSEAPLPLTEFLAHRLEELGVETQEDLELLSDEDYLPEAVPAELAPQLEEKFPFEVDMGDSVYAVEYDLDKKQVMLSQIRGNRKTPPSASYLPKFQGLKIFVEAGGTFHQVRR